MTAVCLIFPTVQGKFEYTATSLNILTDPQTNLHPYFHPTFIESTQVTFADLGLEAIKSYVATGTPM
jgi:hypothetical protein